MSEEGGKGQSAGSEALSPKYVAVSDIFFSSLFSFWRRVHSTNRVHARRVDSSTLVFSLSSHRNSYIGFVFSSRFDDS